MDFLLIFVFYILPMLDGMQRWWKWDKETTELSGRLYTATEHESIVSFLRFFVAWIPAANIVFMFTRFIK